VSYPLVFANKSCRSLNAKGPANRPPWVSRRAGGPALARKCVCGLAGRSNAPQPPARGLALDRSARRLSPARWRDSTSLRWRVRAATAAVYWRAAGGVRARALGRDTRGPAEAVPGRALRKISAAVSRKSVSPRVAHRQTVHHELPENITRALAEEAGFVVPASSGGPRPGGCACPTRAREEQSRPNVTDGRSGPERGRPTVAGRARPARGFLRPLAACPRAGRPCDVPLAQAASAAVAFLA
jgi:hypothetical protein